MGYPDCKRCGHWFYARPQAQHLVCPRCLRFEITRDDCVLCHAIRGVSKGRIQRLLCPDCTRRRAAERVRDHRRRQAEKERLARFGPVPLLDQGAIALRNAAYVVGRKIIASLDATPARPIDRRSKRG